MSGKGQSTTVTISIWSMVSAVLVVAAVYAIWSVREIIVLVFVALILASALYGWVQWFHRHHIPKTIAVLLIYIVLFLLTSGVVALLIPPLIEQIQSIASHLPEVITRITSNYGVVKEFTTQAGVSEQVARLLQTITPQASSTVGIITGFFGSIVSFAVVLIIALYIIVEDHAISNALQSVIPDKYSTTVGSIVIEIQSKIGMWLRGQMVLMLIIAVLSYVGLLILGVNNALALALFAGITEVVPNLGPIIGSIPAILIAFADSPIKAVFVVILYILIQQLENNVIVPQVMRRATGINPVVSLIALLVGAKVGGVPGALLAIPTVTALKVIGDRLFDAHRAVEPAPKS